MKLFTIFPLLAMGFLTSFVAECEEPEPECESSDYCPPGGSYTITGKVASDCTFSATSSPKAAGGSPAGATGAGAYDADGNNTDADAVAGGGPATVNWDSGTKTVSGTVAYDEGGMRHIDTGYWTPRGK